VLHQRRLAWSVRKVQALNDAVEDASTAGRGVYRCPANEGVRGSVRGSGPVLRLRKLEYLNCDFN